ncbi:MAG TPA: hypothetical protein DCG47_15250 [Spirochaetaceae bacterium]|jgi:hypothetical protein|nr:hypothetical protein [Spirochaetaceae bacterium]
MSRKEAAQPASAPEIAGADTPAQERVYLVAVPEGSALRFKATVRASKLTIVTVYKSPAISDRGTSLEGQADTPCVYLAPVVKDRGQQVYAGAIPDMAHPQHLDLSIAGAHKALIVLEAAEGAILGETRATFILNNAIQAEG